LTQTNAMLAIDGVTTTNAGNYFVVVSNATGMTTSQVATLIVGDNETRPSLVTDKSPSPNHFSFNLFGDMGRHYRIETSLDLKNWSAETSFPMHLYWPSHQNLTSVIFNSDVATSLSVPPDSDRKFVRASNYTPVNAVCNSNLKQIRYAKFKWAWEHSKTSTDSPGDAELFPGLPAWRAVHHCPQGGTYTTQAVGNPPTCSITNHILEEPR